MLTLAVYVVPSENKKQKASAIVSVLKKLKWTMSKERFSAWLIIRTREAVVNMMHETSNFNVLLAEYEWLCNLMPCELVSCKSKSRL